MFLNVFLAKSFPSGRPKVFTCGETLKKDIKWMLQWKIAYADAHMLTEEVGQTYPGEGAKAQKV